MPGIVVVALLSYTTPRDTIVSADCCRSRRLGETENISAYSVGQRVNDLARYRVPISQREIFEEHPFYRSRNEFLQANLVLVFGYCPSPVVYGREPSFARFDYQSGIIDR
jgi:hypothetical protein